MSVSITDILDGVVIIGSQFSEPMRVVGNPTAGDGFVLVNLVGTRTSTFRGGVTLTKTDLGSIQIERKEALFGGKAPVAAAAQPRVSWSSTARCSMRCGRCSVPNG